MKKSRFTDEQIIGFLKQVESGVAVKDSFGAGTAGGTAAAKAGCSWASNSHAWRKLTLCVLITQSITLPPASQPKQCHRFGIPAIEASRSGVRPKTCQVPRRQNNSVAVYFVSK